MKLLNFLQPNAIKAKLASSDLSKRMIEEVRCSFDGRDDFGYCGKNIYGFENVDSLYHGEGKKSAFGFYFLEAEK